jgi:glycerol-3-phosphate acyltransferase PlsY
VTATWPLVAAALGGYLVGSIPFGLLLTRAAGLGDIRAIGSGSIGATNVLRTGSKGLAAATLLLDAAKGAGAVLLARRLVGADAALLAGAGAMIGHLFPLWLGFRGGKGVATGLGVLLAVSWPVALAALATWLAVALVFRISSLAALAACVAAPIVAWTLSGGGGRTVLLIALLALAVVAKHHANIRRLLDGTEPKIGAR